MQQPYPSQELTVPHNSHRLPTLRQLFVRMHLLERAKSLLKYNGRICAQCFWQERRSSKNGRLFEDQGKAGKINVMAKEPAPTILIRHMFPCLASPTSSVRLQQLLSLTCVQESTTELVDAGERYKWGCNGWKTVLNKISGLFQIVCLAFVVRSPCRQLKTRKGK